MMALNFHGFQKQKNIRTVEFAIENSLNKILNSYELLYAGRTDGMFMQNHKSLA